jgi:hypothetical protein
LSSRFWLRGYFYVCFAEQIAAGIFFCIGYSLKGDITMSVIDDKLQEVKTLLDERAQRSKTSNIKLADKITNRYYDEMGKFWDEYILNGKECKKDIE